MIQSLENKKLFAKFETSINGLNESEVAVRLKKYGPNDLKEEKKKNILIEFFKEFKDLMVIILIIASLISFVAGETLDAGVIFGIVILNALIGFIQKYKAEKAIEALKKLISPHSRVIRSGKETLVEASNLVVGDIVLLFEGDRVNADIQLIETYELYSIESTLTGESMPILKTSDEIKSQNTAIAERKNMVFMGTSIARGKGKGIVVATGMSTEFGKIANLTTNTKKDKSPLENEIAKIGKFVGKITLVICSILFALGFFKENNTLLDSFLFSVSVAVAAVPEGLPATITIALALGVKRMAQKNAIIKQLTSVETLGSTTVICSDKTGTLTQNQMTVQEIHTESATLILEGIGYKPHGKVKALLQQNGEIFEFNNEPEKLKNKDKTTYDEVKLLCLTAAMCNNSTLQNSKNQYSILGDPTEGALLTMSEKIGFSIPNFAKNYEKIYELPFDSVRKRMSVICASEKENLTLVKGAPEEILSICTQIFQNGKVEKITKQHIKKYTELNRKMGENAKRVIAFAYKKNTNSSQKSVNEIESNLIFIGLVGMSDPPREEVKQAVELATKAGIKIYILTGDQGLTALAIAKELLIVKSINPTIINGNDIEKMSKADLKKALKSSSEIIFARVSPAHKLLIVECLKELREVVAVTGDGVNDAPALKRADIGIAMGITGTDVSKEAANMVLTDDKFGTIVNAIQEGRLIYSNLKKFIFYIFSCNIGELFTIFIGIILGVPAPLTAILILAVNLGTDVLPALALGVDEPDPNIMNERPRPMDSKIMQTDFIKRFTIVGICIGTLVFTVFIYTLQKYGWHWGDELLVNSMNYKKATTAAFAMLVMIQMINAFNARNENSSIFKIGFFTNKYLLGSIVISIGTLVLFIHLPIFNKLLETTALTGIEWLYICIASFGILLIEEVRKIFIKIKNA